MDITPALLQKIKLAVEKAGNPSKFAKMLPGIKQTTVRNWMLGITKSISEENWRKVSVVIKTLLPQEKPKEEIKSQLLKLKNTYDRFEAWIAKTKLPEEKWITQKQYNELLEECVVQRDITRDYIKHAINLIDDPNVFEEIVNVVLKEDYIKDITLDDVYPDY